MTSRSLFALSAAAATLTACQSVAAPPSAVAHAAMSASVDLSIGRTAEINGMKITPLSIVEDSRCPANANASGRAGWWSRPGSNSRAAARSFS